MCTVRVVQRCLQGILCEALMGSVQWLARGVLPPMQYLCTGCLYATLGLAVCMPCMEI